MLNIIIVISLAKFLQTSGNVLACALLYAAWRFIIGVIFGHFSAGLVIATVIGFALAYLYFFLLNRLQDSGPMYWVVFIGGALLGLV